MGSDFSFVQDLLKRFGTLIYTGNRLDDYVIMELELQDLYDYKMISAEDYLKAKSILLRLRNEIEK